MEFILINLEKAKDRLNDQIFHYGDLKINRFNAIYGKEVQDDQFLSLPCKLFCSDSMIGCGLSHIHIWNIISKKSNNKLYLIHEDDVFIDFKILDLELLYLFDKYDMDILHISKVNNGEINSTCIEKIDNHGLFKTKILGTGAYIITPKSAKKLLKKIQTLKYHIDVQIYFSDVNQYVIYPYLSKVTGYTTSSQSSHHDKYILKIFRKFDNLNYLYFILKMPILSMFRLYDINLYMILTTVITFICFYKYGFVYMIIGILLGFSLSDF